MLFVTKDLYKPVRIFGSKKLIFDLFSFDYTRFVHHCYGQERRRDAGSVQKKHVE